jgi:uncharacterized protein YprB with RNaseH-like and TPR domain
MLKHTFQHIHGIGEKTEKRIWAAGITNWEEFLDSPCPAALPLCLRDMACRELEQSLRALEFSDAPYFHERLPKALHWRLYPEFGQRIAYLDIETTGMTAGTSAITVIGLYDGEQPQVYVQGQNLSCFADVIEDFTLLVTYNGKLFDLPFIRQELGLPLNQAHIDLRYPLAALGYKGGLKKIERSLGVEREGVVALLDGWCAVLLWQYHEQGEEGALETLLRYNLEDVIHLPTLLALVYNTRIQPLPFRLPPFAPPSPPSIPFGFHQAIIDRVLAATGRNSTISVASEAIPTC